MVKIMVFDIETNHLKADIFRPGKQVIQHGSLDPAHNTYDIISISWMDNIKRTPKALHWGYKDESSADMLNRFDQIIKKYQDDGFIIMGKNNNRFDNKYINMMRWYHKHEPIPEWGKYTGDLEQQIRKNFYLPSYSLDYMSQIRDLGGKDKMQFSDWQQIVRAKKAHKAIASIGKEAVKEIAEDLLGVKLSIILKEGKAALDKMIDYNKKDVVDTLLLIEDILPYVELKNPFVTDRVSNRNADHSHLFCKRCGGYNIRKHNSYGGHKYFYCMDCNTTAGRVTIKKNGQFGEKLV